jgi:hypothetical protein
MTRGLTTPEAALVTAPNVIPFAAIEVAYDDGTVRLCSLPVRSVQLLSAMTDQEEAFFGAGGMGAISAVQAGSEARSYGITATLSGIPGNWAAYLRTQDVQGRAVRVYRGFCDRLYTPLLFRSVWVGRGDAQYCRTGESTDVTVAAESVLIDWERGRVRRCTDVDQQGAHPGDKFFQYVAALEGQNLMEPA